MKKNRSFLDRWRLAAFQLRAETFALYLAARDPRTPWYVKLFLVGVVAYALSPIDLIPDFIPLLGYLDDFLLIPFCILLARKMVPSAVLAECRTRAQEEVLKGTPGGRIAATLIVVLWLLVMVVCAIWLYEAIVGGERL